jgi:hypothetical protein
MCRFSKSLLSLMFPIHIVNILFDLIYISYEGQYKSKVQVFFLRKCSYNNIEIYMDHSYIFCNYEAIFPQSCHHFQNTFANND